MIPKEWKQHTVDGTDSDGTVFLLFNFNWITEVHPPLCSSLLLLLSLTVCCCISDLLQNSHCLLVFYPASVKKKPTESLTLTPAVKSRYRICFHESLHNITHMHVHMHTQTVNRNIKENRSKRGKMRTKRGAASCHFIGDLFPIGWGLFFLWTEWSFYLVRSG